MLQRWVLPCVAEIPEVVINSILIQAHVPVLVDACVARWRLQLAGRLVLASTVSIGDSPKAPAPRSSGLWRGAGAHSPVYREKSEAVRPRAWLPQQATEPLLLNPQVCSYPALTETKEPAGGVAWRSSLLPQQAAEPLLLTPHVCTCPASTETKEPAGGVALPCLSLPQQATEPSLLTPQVWNDPALTERKEPAGGVAWPWLLRPQQATEPLLLTPQVW